MGKIKLADLMSFSIERFEADGYEFIEHTLKLRCTPSVATQLFAFKGVAHDEAGELVHVGDWDKISPHVLGEINRTLFTSYRSYLLGNVQPENDGTYILRSGQVGAVVGEGGSISIPDPREARKRGKNFGRTVLL